MFRSARAAGLTAALVWAVGCSSDSASFEDAPSRSEGAPSPAQDAPGAGAAAGEQAPPPEREEESTFQTPVATDRFVWVANPRSGHVAFIDATTFEVRIAQAGNGPTTLAAVPGAGDAAIVLNSLSRDATLLRTSGSGSAVTVTSRTFPTAPNLNTWAISPSGRWAIAWTDVRLVQGARKTQGFQDITVVDLTERVAPKSLAVGYRPLSVGFAAGEATAYAITEAGATILDLGGASGPSAIRNVQLTANPADDPASRDVSVSPDGAYAFVRVNGSPDLTAVELASGTRTPIHFPGNLTDFDLSSDGRVGVAAMREAGQVAVVQLPAALTSPAAITSVPATGMGSVVMAPGSGSAVLYSNAIPTERVEILGLGAAPASRGVRLYAPVRAVFASPDAKHAVVLHEDVGGQSAYSLVPMDRDLPPRIEEAPASPFKVAFSPSGDRALIVLRSDARKSYALEIAKLPELMTTRIDLASPPLAAGIVQGANRAFVAQDHPEGRITFIDLDTQRARTLTGFELGSRVVDGSRP